MRLLVIQTLFGFAVVLGATACAIVDDEPVDLNPGDGVTTTVEGDVEIPDPDPTLPPIPETTVSLTDITTPIDTTEEVALFDESENAKAVQQKLALLGIDPGPIDGIFGIETSEAIAVFQANVGVPETGVADPGTLTLLDLAQPGDFPEATTTTKAVTTTTEEVTTTTEEGN